jgi:mannitol-1-phosphate/altronate dehydrogenase
MRKLVLFGAGKIGRSFIGQLFATSGYEVVFIDVIEPIIRELNRLNEYKVVFKSSQPDVIIPVGNVRGVLGNDTGRVADEISDLTDHIDDLLGRFENRALGDTLFRVGCDLKRKLHRNDRILGPLRDGIKTNSPVNKIVLTFNYALFFRARDENGNMFPGDQEFSRTLEEKGISYVLNKICGLSDTYNQIVIQKILKTEFIKSRFQGS